MSTAVLRRETESDVRVTARTLRERSQMGAIIVAFLALAVAATTRFRLHHPWATTSALVLLLGCAVLRLTMQGSEGESEHHARQWLRRFRIGALFSAGIWGSSAAAAAGQQLDADTLTLLVPTAGIVAGATSSLSPDLRLVRAYLLLMLVPVISSVALRWGLHGAGVSGSICLFLLYSWLQAAHQHRSFWAAVHQNVELRAHANALELARSAAEAADRRKSEFMAYVSHEMRTPLTSIIGYAELLEKELPPSAGEDLRVISRGGRQLLEIVNQLLIFESLEKSGLELESREFQLGEVLSDVRDLVQVQATSRGIDLHVEPTASTIIVGDPGRLRQILVNLVANALKFTDHGGVRVQSRLEGDAPQALLVCEIIDSGIGMSQEAVAQLFVPFKRVENASNGTREGTGLGLAISQRLARLMGGDITVQSQLNVGSTFTLRVPLQVSSNQVARQSAAGEGREGATSLAGVKVLVVDDSPEIRSLLSAVLGRAGAEVHCADDGADAVLAALRTHYDLVLMDVRMPGLDGCDAVSALRTGGFTRPIIALTGDVSESGREQYLDAGFNWVVCKPIDATAVVRCLADFHLHGYPSQATLAYKELQQSGPMPCARGEIRPKRSLLSQRPELREFVLEFIEDLRHRITDLQQASENSDREQLLALSHRLAGSGGTFGFQDITDTARQLERMLRAEAADPRRIPTAVQELIRACSAACEAAIRDAAASEALARPSESTSPVAFAEPARSSRG
ncbi:MAG TPA: ATP-binding protein [Polyangiaceae bacterium]|nr:ATP-binding protein [Polyangiaceae bacterium]